MKYILLSSLLGLAVFSCNDARTDAEYDAAEQDLTPTSDVNSQPEMTEETTSMSGDMTSIEHFDAALISLEGNRASEAADHMDMGISSLMAEGRDLQDSTHQEFKMVVEQLEDASARLRAGEATDQQQLERLIDQAEELARQ